MDKSKTVFELILDALEEAVILEYGRSYFDNENVLLSAMRLSGAPYSFVKIVAEKNGYIHK